MKKLKIKDWIIMLAMVFLTINSFIIDNWLAGFGWLTAFASYILYKFDLD